MNNKIENIANMTEVKLDGYSNYTFTDKGTIINQYGRVIGNNSHNNGYTITTLVSDNGDTVRRSTHIWVYNAFYGEIPQGKEISHIDDNKHNNAPYNLEAVTHKLNCNTGNRNKKISLGLRAYHARKKAEVKQE